MQLKIQCFLPSSPKRQINFRNMHPLMLMKEIRETKAITLASDFKGLRSSI